MSVGESIKAGLGELWAYKARTALQTTGVALGAASFILTVALIQGGRQEDRDWMETRGGITKLEVRPKSSGRHGWWRSRNFGLTLEDLNVVQEAVEPLGASVSAVQRLQMRAVAYGEPTRSIVMGVLPPTLEMDGRTLLHGRYLTEGDVRTAAPVVVVGTDVAKNLFGALDVVGLEIRLVPRGQAAGREPNRYKIVGVLDEKVYRRSEDQGNWLSWMNRQVHLPLTSALHREVGNRQIGTIQVKAPRIEDVKRIKRVLEGSLERSHRGELDFSISDREEQLQEWEERSRVYWIAIGGSGAISLLVGGIVIMNILLASFAQRVREVGLRKALGARDSEVFLQFVVESVLVAGTGGVAGVLIGVGFSGTVSRMMEMPLVMSPSVLLIGLFVAAGTGFVFGLYPGFRAARLDPVVALRYE